MIVTITDIVGTNRNGEKCHPYQLKRAPHTGLYSYSFEGNDNYHYCTEAELRKMIEAGKFNSSGTIRMAPAADTNLKRAGAMSVDKYKNKFLPV